MTSGICTSVAWVIFFFSSFAFFSFFGDGRSPPLLLRSHLSYEKAMDLFTTVFSIGSFLRGPAKVALFLKAFS